MSCGKVEVRGFCTSKILLSWQVQIQADINSSVATQHLVAEWLETEILLGGVRAAGSLWEGTVGKEPVYKLPTGV